MYSRRFSLSIIQEHCSIRLCYNVGMYPKDKQTAAMMSEAIRAVLADSDIMDAIIQNTEKKPPYWDMLPEKNGLAAIVIAQMLKAMSGDTQAFTALSRYGFGEKVQMDVSDFYRTDRININVIEPKPLDTIDGDSNNLIEEVIDNADNSNGTTEITEGDASVGETA